MSNSTVREIVSVSRFKGCLVGALLGDCLGAPFEQEAKPSPERLEQYFSHLENPSFVGPVKCFTDDTAMTRAVLESFVEKGSFDEMNVAKRFVANFYKEPSRGYGESVVTVFRKLKKLLEPGKMKSSEQDIWKPARDQFDGSGSLGNGGAMRIAPVALYCYSNYSLMLRTAEKCTRLTHTHTQGIDGALLQAIAVQQSLCEDSNHPLNVDDFVTKIIKKMTEIEGSATVGPDSNEPMRYVKQLQEVKNFLKADHMSDENVIDTLGNSVRALYSVPTALYCFLRAQRPIPSIETDNKFRRAIQYAISLGGDTDTIATMAGAISGGYHGFEYINKELQSHCEGIKDVISLAEQLHALVLPAPAT